MKSSDRCKAHFQGDRCQRAKHHNSPIADNPVANHVGQFTAWTGEGDSLRVVAKSVKTSMKRNRGLNRFLRGLGSFPERFNHNRKQGIEILDSIVKHLRGGIQQ